MIADKTETAVGYDELFKFIEDMGVGPEWVNHDKYGFSRTIEFKVHDMTYRIVWFKNESTLKMGTHKRAPFIPFKFVNLDTTYPIAGGNCIEFSYVKNKRKSIFDSEYPYETFRIPL